MKVVIASGFLCAWQLQLLLALHLFDMSFLFPSVSQVLRTRVQDGINTTFVGYGPETLDPKRVDFLPGVSSFNEYGGHFSLELTEVKSSANAVSRHHIHMVLRCSPDLSNPARDPFLTPGHHLVGGTLANADEEQMNLGDLNDP
jgi:hypothetical protein